MPINPIEDHHEEHSNDALSTPRREFLTKLTQTLIAGGVLITASNPTVLLAGTGTCGGSTNIADPCSGSTNVTNPCAGTTNVNSPCGGSTNIADPCGGATNVTNPCASGTNIYCQTGLICSGGTGGGITNCPANSITNHPTGPGIWFSTAERPGQTRSFYGLNGVF